jgi:phage shock protein A
MYDRQLPSMLSELDAAIDDTAEQVAELRKCLAQLRQNMAELRRVRQAVADMLSQPQTHNYQ